MALPHLLEVASPRPLDEPAPSIPRLQGARRGPSATRGAALLAALALSACGGGAAEPAGGISVDVEPDSAQATPGGSVSFSAAVTGTADTAVLWSVVESGGGSVDGSGRYTAPTSPGTYHVRAASRAAPGVAATATVSVAAPGATATLEVRGRDLVDACGDRLVVRGIDQIFGVADAAGNGPFSLEGSYVALVDQIALTGANAIRIQPQTDLPASDVDAIVGRAVHHGMVVYASNNGRSDDPDHLYSTTWIADPAIRAVLQKPAYARHLVIDALPEPPYDDPARWRAEAIAQIAYARSLGYTQPLALMGNLYGRDLPTILGEGAAIVATDPLGRVQFIWEAYWGAGYEAAYGMTLTEGLEAAAAASFPIGFGLINWAEVWCADLLDYGAHMATAQAHGLSWTWWDWVLPGYRCFDLSTNGYADSLTTEGERVVNGPNGIAATSRKACAP